MPLKNFKRYPGCVASLEETNKAICMKRKRWNTQQLIIKNGTKPRYQALMFHNVNVTNWLMNQQQIQKAGPSSRSSNMDNSLN